MKTINMTMQNYLDVCNQMQQVVKNKISEYGGKVVINLEQYKTFAGYNVDDEEFDYPVTLTMPDNDGNYDTVKVESVELDGDTIYVNGEFGAYEVNNETIYWVLEYLHIWEKMHGSKDGDESVNETPEAVKETFNYESLLSIVMWDYNRNPLTESLTVELFNENYGTVMGQHYYDKFVNYFHGDLLKMIGYFRGENKEGQIFCDMISKCIEKYKQRIIETYKNKQ